MKTLLSFGVGAAILFSPGGLPAQAMTGGPHGGGPGAAPANAMPAAHLPMPNASARSNSIQAILQKFDASRDQLASGRQALIDQLATAQSDTARQAILDQLRQEQQSMQDTQRAMAKEIRAELQTFRRQHVGG